MAVEAEGGPAGFLQLRIRWEADACVLELHGELDLSTAAQLEDAVHAAATTGCAEVVVDMAGVAFADLRGLQPVLDGCRGGMPLRLRDAPPSVLRMLALDPSPCDVVPLEWSARAQ